jgi:hypothetical protein
MVRRVNPQHAGRQTVDRPTDIQMRFLFEMSGSAGDPQVLEDSDQEAPRPNNGSRSFIDLSTPSPPPPVRILPLRDLSRSATSSLNPTALKPLSKRTSLRSSTPRTPHDPTPIKVSASGSKKSPGFPHKAANGMSQNGHESPLGRNSPHDENGVGREEDERSEKPYDLRGDSSRHPSLDGPDSQESLGRSIGSTSPLLIRLKEQRNRVGNPPSDSNFPRSSPQEEILERNGSFESGSQNQDSTDAKIKQFLLNFEREMLDDHAASVRWLLYDSKQPVEHPDPFLEEISPFASKEPVSMLPGSVIIPEVATTVKMETFVCILSTPVDHPAHKYRPAGRIEPEN